MTDHRQLASELKDAIKVNESLLAEANRDITNFDYRMQSQRERIDEAQRRMEQLENNKNSAPERINKITQRIEKLKLELSTIAPRSVQRKSKAESSKSEAIAQEMVELTQRLTEGDTSVIERIRQLASQLTRK